MLFGMRRIMNNAFHRTNPEALRVCMMAYALGTEPRINLVDLLALRNRTIWAFRFANVAVNTFVGNQKRHRV